jgi:hypothetical protein
MMTSRRRRGRRLRVSAILATVVFGAVASVALATDNLHPHPHPNIVASPPVALALPAPATAAPPTPAVGATATAPTGLSAPTPGLVPTESGASTPPVSSSGAATGGVVPGSPPATPAKVAVVSAVLSTFSFGSKIGLPLLCGVAIGAVGQFLTNPALSSVATTISSSCAMFGNQGSAALTQLNQQLAALAAVDPAVDPVLQQLAGVFNGAAANSSIPFAAEVGEVAGLLNFFSG